MSQKFIRRVSPLIPRLLLVLLILSMLSWSAPRVKAALDVTCTRYHTVWWGENLYRIGLRYGVNWQTLMSWNNLYSTIIYPGQVLCVATTTPPPPPECKQTYTVQRGDNLYRIGLRYNVSWITLMYWNGWFSWLIYPGQVLCVAK
jgi:LysM repeat protein